MERIKDIEKKYKLVSLFAGIGGIDLGFEFAGFDCIWANDFDKFACQTYRANVGDQMVEGDIRLTKEQIPDHDILVGGFPCQPFSTLGKLQGFDDEKNRGTLFFEIMDIITKHDTKVVVLENVKNLVNHDDGKTFARIKQELNDAGYDVKTFDSFLDRFDSLIGIDKIWCIHINDSKNTLGAHKDRHENFGFGTIGFDTLVSVVYNERLSQVPKILETPYVDREYPPYKYEIEMIKNKTFDTQLIEKIKEQI